MVHYLSKFADFTLPHLHLSPPLGVNPFEFRKDFWRQKTRVPGLSYGVVCVFLCLAILVEHRLVTDRRTHDHGIYRASIASRGKNSAKIMCDTSFQRRLIAIVEHFWLLLLVPGTVSFRARLKTYHFSLCLFCDWSTRTVTDFSFWTHYVPTGTSNLRI